MSKKTLILVSQRIDPSLFDTRLFTTKIVTKDTFLPDFFLEGTAFIYIHSIKGDENRTRILRCTQNFARVVIFASSPTPQLQLWLEELSKPPTLFVVPGTGPEFISSVLVSTLPLIKTMSKQETRNELLAKVRNHAQNIVQQHFVRAKSFEALSHCMTCSTGIAQPVVHDLIKYFGSLQRLSLQSRDSLRQIGVQENDVQAVASFFDVAEIEAPTYM